jgi:hypothetical protein
MAARNPADARVPGKEDCRPVAAVDWKQKVRGRHALFLKE